MTSTAMAAWTSCANDSGSFTDWLAQADRSFAWYHLGVNPAISWHVQDPFA